MGLRCHRPSLLAAAALSALLVCASGARAGVITETRIYRWHEPDGTAVMSNVAPPPVVKNYSIDTVATPALSDEQRAAAAGQLDGYRAELATPVKPDDDAIARARERLQRARHQRTVGREPLPGERLHNVTGGSRLSPLYYERQAELEAAVANAQARLNEAYRQHSAALR